jgi:hypothetical protein
MTTGRETFTGTPEEREILAAIAGVHARIKRLSDIDPGDLDVAALGVAEEELASLRAQLADAGARVPPARAGGHVVNWDRVRGVVSLVSALLIVGSWIVNPATLPW